MAMWGVIMDDRLASHWSAALAAAAAARAALRRHRGHLRAGARYRTPNHDRPAAAGRTEQAAKIEGAIDTQRDVPLIGATRAVAPHARRSIVEHGVAVVIASSGDGVR